MGQSADAICKWDCNCHKRAHLFLQCQVHPFDHASIALCACARLSAFADLSADAWLLTESGGYRLSDLPDDTLFIIISAMDQPSRASLAQTARRFRYAMDHGTLEFDLESNTSPESFARCSNPPLIGRERAREGGRERGRERGGEGGSI